MIRIGKYEGAPAAIVPEEDLRLLLRHYARELAPRERGEVFAELDRRAAVARREAARENQYRRRKRLR